MKFAQLDEIRCTCGSRDIRLESSAVGEVHGLPPVEQIRCRNVCGYKQRPVKGQSVDISECRQCQMQRIIEGAVVCNHCGHSWPITGGHPLFSCTCLNQDALEGLRVVETDPQLDPRWEPFVLGNPTGLVYHHPGWITALEREYGRKGVHLLCEDADGQALAVMPMLHTRGLPLNLGGRLSGRRLSSLPRTPLGGPLSKDPRATIAILRAAAKRGSQDRGTELQIKTEGPALDGLVAEMACSPWRLSYLLRLPGCSEGSFRIADSHNRAAVKRAINKAARLGVRLRLATTETDLGQWYRLYLEVMRTSAVPPRPYRLFSTLMEVLGAKGMMQLLLAEQHTAGKTSVVAGSIFLALGQRVTYAFSGARSCDLPLRANDLILWEAINGACRQGFRCLDLGEVPEGNRGLATFKSKWGAEPVRLYRYYYPLSPSRVEVNGEQSGRYWRPLVESVWRRLPLKVVEWLGDRVYSYL